VPLMAGDEGGFQCRRLLGNEEGKQRGSAPFDGIMKEEVVRHLFPYSGGCQRRP
jgi:hypothetical protein